MSHSGCKRGYIGQEVMFCSSVETQLRDTTLKFIVFEDREVETFGKGKPFKRMEKVENLLTCQEFVSECR